MEDDQEEKGIIDVMDRDNVGNDDNSNNPYDVLSDENNSDDEGGHNDNVFLSENNLQRRRIMLWFAIITLPVHIKYKEENYMGYDVVGTIVTK